MTRPPDFNAEMRRLRKRMPAWAGRLMVAARRPGAIWWRIPLAAALMLGGMLGFLPLLGFWMLPLGFALVAVDVPLIRRPLARMLAFINRKLAPLAGS